MKKRTIPLIVILLLIITMSLTACDFDIIEKDGPGDHYKPEEYKYDVILNEAVTTIHQIDQEIAQMKHDNETDEKIEFMLHEYKSILNEQLKILKESEKNINSEKNLNRAEKKNLVARNNEIAKSMEKKIKDLDKQIATYPKR